MADKRLNYVVGFTADTTQLKKSMDDVQQSLNNISMGMEHGVRLPNYLSEASRAASELSAHLHSAYNAETGKLDLSKLNNSLRQSNTSLTEYSTKLSSLGPEGQNSFMQVANAIASAELPLMRSTALIDKFFTTLTNTLRWMISSNIINSFVGMFQTAYGYAKDLNKSLTSIQIVSKKTSEDMKEFAVQANKAAAALSSTTIDYTDASRIFFQQGLPEDQVTARTDVAIKMANVTGQTTEDISDQLTAIWNNFRDGSKSLEYYADVITALGANTASSSKEISDGLGKFAAVAKTVGLSYEYATAALATTVASTRESADIVGNAFKTLFGRLENLKLGETLEDGVTLGKYGEALEKVGISLYDSNGQLKQMDQILNDLGARWQTLAQDEQIALAETIGGERQYRFLVALLNEFDTFKENIDIAKNSLGELQKQQDIYADSWEAVRNQVRAAAEEVYGNLINPDVFINLDKALIPLINLFADFVKVAGGLPGILNLVFMVMSKLGHDQIASGLRYVVDQFKVLTSVSQKEAIGLKSELIPAIQEYLTLSGNNPADQQMISSLSKKVQYQIRSNELQRELTQSQRESLEIEKIVLENAIRLEEEYAQQAKDKAQIAKDALIEAENSLPGDFSKKIKRVSEDSNALKTSSVRGKIVWGAEEAGQRQWQLIENDIKLVNKEQVKANDLYLKYLSSLKGSSQQLGQLEQLKSTFSQLEEGSEKMTKAQELFHNIMGKPFETSTKEEQIKEIDKAINDASNSSQDFQRILQVLFDSDSSTLREAFYALGRGLELTEEQAKAVELAFGQMDKKIVEVKSHIDWADVVVNMANLASSVASLTRSLSSLKKAFSDESLSGGERFSQILQSASMAAFSFNQILSVLAKTTLGKTFASGMANAGESVSFLTKIFKGLGAVLATPEGQIIALIAVTITLFIWLTNIESKNEKLKKKFKELNEEIDKNKEELESINEELKTTQQRIKELQDKGSLSLVEAQELRQLQLQEQSLRNQSEYIDKIQKYNAKQAMIAYEGQDEKTYEAKGTTFEVTQSFGYYRDKDTGKKDEYTSLKFVMSSLEDVEQKRAMALKMLNSGNYTFDEKDFEEFNRKLDKIAKKIEENLLENDRIILDIEKDWNKYISDSILAGEQINEEARLTKLTNLRNVYVTQYGGKAELADAQLTSNALKTLDNNTLRNFLQNGKLSDEILQYSIYTRDYFDKGLNNIQEAFGDNYQNIINQLTDEELNWLIDRNNLGFIKDYGDEVNNIVKGLKKAAAESGELKDNLNKISNPLFSDNADIAAFTTALKDAASATKELEENGALSFSTLQSLHSAFGDSIYSQYAEVLESSTLSASELEDALNGMLNALFQQKELSGDLAGASEETIAKWLKEAGVAEDRAKAIAHNIKLEQDFKDSVGAALSSGAFDKRIQKIYEEGQAYGFTTEEIESLILQQTLFNIQDLDVEDKIKKLESLAGSFAKAAEAAQLFKDYTNWVREINETPEDGYFEYGSREADLEAADRLLQKGLADLTRKTYSFGTLNSSDSSKGSGSSSDTLKYFSEYLNDVDRKIQALQNRYDDLEETISRTFDPTKIAEYRKEQAQILEDEKALYEEREQLARNRQANSRSLLESTLSKAGISTADLFDANGNIINEIGVMSQLQNAYNNNGSLRNLKISTPDGDKDIWEAVTWAIDDYSNALNEANESHKNLIQKLREERDLDLQKIKDAIDTKKAYQEERDALEELDKSFNSLYKYSLGYQIATTNLNIGALDKYSQDISFREEQIKKLREELSKPEANEKEIQQQINDLLKENQEDIKKSIDIINSLGDELGKLIDTVLAPSKELIEAINRNKELANSYKDVANLLRNVTGATSTYYSTVEAANRSAADAALLSAEVSQSVYEQARVQYEKEKAILDLMDPNELGYATQKNVVDKYRQEMESAYDAMLSSAKDAINAAGEIFQTQVDQAVRRYERSLSTIGLDYLKQDLDNFLDENERYLDTVERFLQTNILNNKVQQSIDATTSDYAKSVLQNLQEEFALRQANEKLSQYDLDIMNAKYEMTLKQIALEEAQNAKNQMRLVRNAAGNYSYAFTADADAISSAQQDLYQSQLDFYELANQKVKDATNELIELQKQYKEEVLKVWESADLTPEEKERQVNRLRDYYLQKAQDIYQQKDVAIQDFVDASIGSVGEVDNRFLDILNSMGGSMGEFEDAVLGFTESTRDAFEEYSDTVTEMANITNLSYRALRRSINAADAANMQYAADASIVNAAMESQFKELDKMAEKWQNIANRISIALALQAAFNGKTVDYSRIMAQAYMAGDMDAYRMAANMRMQKIIDEGLEGKVQSTGDIDRQIQEAARSGDMKKLKDWGYGSSYFGFDSGGYTGNWNTNDGKLAFLHQKELVLNQEDTQRILDAVSYARTLSAAQLSLITDYLDSQTSSVFGLMAAKLGSPIGQAAAAGTLNQNVAIEANFPNVTSAVEIENALRELVNRSAQYANKRY